MNLHLQIFAEEALPAEEAVTSEAATPEEEFGELIKGKYADAFKNRVQGIIDKRFSKMKAMEKSLEELSPLKEHLEARFPHISPHDTAALVAEYLKSENTQPAAKPRRALPEAFLERASGLIKMKAAQRMRDGLLRESAELRRLYPSFDLKRELSSSPEMRRLISAGVPLRRAYEAVNLEAVTGEIVKAAVLRARLETAESIRLNSRVQENSLSDRAASQKHTDVNNLTEAEIRKIITDVGNGARVTF